MTADEVDSGRDYQHVLDWFKANSGVGICPVDVVLAIRDLKLARAEIDRLRAALSAVGAASAETAIVDQVLKLCHHHEGLIPPRSVKTSLLIGTIARMRREQRADPVHVQQPAEPCDEGCCKNSPCDFQEDNPVHVQRDERAERGDGGRDPHCALPHPHGRSNRCAGD